jgi:phosphate transport system permease protein
MRVEMNSIASEANLTEVERRSKDMMNANKIQIVLDKGFQGIFTLAGLISVLAVFSITIFIFSKGIQPFIPGNAEGNYSLVDFITGTVWKPGQGIFGIGYMIVASVLGTFGAIIIGVPIGIFTAVYIAEIASPKVSKIVKSLVELLAGIPSVLYGVFGFSVIMPMIKKISPFNIGDSLFSVILILSIMILPTIVSVSETAIRAVPYSYREGAYGLGATKMEVIFKTVLPAAKSGILAATVLGVGRAIGETMAVILVAGNPESGIPESIYSTVRLITNNIVLEQGYASGLHAEMLFSTGVVLFVFIMIINILLSKIQKKVGND